MYHPSLNPKCKNFNGGKIVTADGYLMPCSFFHGGRPDMLKWVKDNNLNLEDLKIDGRSVEEIDNSHYMQFLNETLRTGENTSIICRNTCNAKRELGDTGISNWKTVDGK